ncbi:MULTISPECIES: cupin domain-containing protein [unclassified Rhodococcus (in: high G+C Gram-positive bacteria)]|uniref:cupin domain-containing protein n=1 Tax=unclassified Rhodococcus (in: high G+C Gram-positive bacteria) TaxID=192944 RepID=UPI0016394F28|nr:MULTISPECIES: cupin domain-containing protein [unclassified Rhodococcus (in: high G+C Gram-positive bacteria)]MBC2637762.1 cupin domain-containing protein [Rhodococcus sp. 3A]MBC2897493.1 cupin domain-containing protein [Rhodococcus sp. 4CII]
MTTTEHKPAVTNGAFRTPSPGREVRYKTGADAEKAAYVLAEASQTNQKLSVALHELEPGEKSGNHMHTLEDEGFFVLEGTVTFFMPHDDLVIEAGPREFVWHPVGRAHSFQAGDQPAKLLQFIVPGKDLVPEFFEAEAGVDTSTSEQLSALAEKSFRELGIRVFGPDATPPSTRPAMARGPRTPDARLLMPDESDRKLNNPFKSDARNKLVLNVDRGAMTSGELIFHAWGHQTGDLFELLEVAWTKPDIVFPHVHTLEEEGFYVLEGEFTLYVAEPEGITKQVGHPGDFIWGPRDYPHYYHISGEQGARVLTCFVPGGAGFLNFFLGIATEGRGADLSTLEKLQDFQDWTNKTSGQYFLGPDEWPGEFPTPVGGGTLS